MKGDGIVTPPRGVRKRGRLNLILGTLLAALAFGAVASADDISNTVDGTVDAVAEVMPLNVGGASGTTRLTSSQGGDGKPGCNLTGSTTLGVSVSSSDPSVATVSPSTITFTSCINSSTGSSTSTVTPQSAGSATITVTQTSNTTGGTFNLAAATFSVVVSPPPNTPPNVSSSVSSAERATTRAPSRPLCVQVSDAEDGNLFVRRVA